MNKMTLQFDSKLENEAFARTSAVAFLMPLNLTMEVVMEIKTILAEAVVNAMIHGYEGVENGEIILHMEYDTKCIEIRVEDKGCGIEDIDQAMQPLYTTKQHLERSGMGLTIMQTFADDFQITSSKNEGTTVKIKKRIDDGTSQVHE